VPRGQRDGPLERILGFLDRDGENKNLKNLSAHSVWSLKQMNFIDMKSSE
jgi:hypothetical protein